MKNILDEVIKSSELIFEKSYVQICDCALKFHYVGESFAKELGLSPKALIGRNLVEVKSKIQNLSLSYNRINHSVMKNRTAIEYITVLKDSKGIHCYKNKSIPIKREKEVFGVFIDTSPIDFQLNMLTQDSFLKLTKNGGIVIKSSEVSWGKISNSFNELIAYLIMLGMTDKEIPQILQRLNIFKSSSSVSKIITRNIYSILGATTRADFIKKLHQQGLVSKVPFVLRENMEDVAEFLLSK